MFSKHHWWKFLLGVLVMGGVGVLLMGVQTYREAPPIPDFVDAGGGIVVAAESVRRGQIVFQKYALMEYGSMFGDGGMRGPDFTAESLHEVALAMTRHYDGDAERARREIKENRHRDGVVTLTEGQVRAWHHVADYYRRKFTEDGRESFRPRNYITDPQELRDLSAFFFWGAWVCGARRPGSDASYTHNWPYDEAAGNRLTGASVFWSVVGALALILALGAVLYFYGRTSGQVGWQPGRELDPVATAESVGAFVPSETQRLTYRFFAVAAVLFLLQVLSGVLTVHDFVGFTVFFGQDISRVVPLTVARSWHVQLSVLWIATCWIAGSIFVLPKISPAEPPGQARLIRILFWTLATVVGGTVVGGILGPHGLLGRWWSLLGNQGWEFVELGRLWQAGLFAALVLWAVIVFRGVRPAIRASNPFALPSWMMYSVVAIVVLFLSSFVASPRTNFVVADFWRWMVIHMWAECFFEVFTTVVIAYFMVIMGLVGREAASRVVYFGTLLFLGSGFVGISHNFYWNGKPEATLALGSVFSTMQVVPLILLTVEAWKFRRIPAAAISAALPVNGRATFGLPESFAFLVAVNFWNFLGAGVFGFIVNLPVVNYFEHGTYLTVNHGHAALMGVYGNLSIAAILFCSRFLVRPEAWNGALHRVSFWSLNLGLLLMVLLDLLPAGVLQLRATLDRGLWYARSQELILGDAFQTLTYLRVVGGVLFLLGGVAPLAWFMVTRWRRLKDSAAPVPEPAEPAPVRVRSA